MLSVTGYRLMLWTQPADMRTGAHGLSGIVCNELKEDPFLGGTIYVFFNARRTTVKMLELCKRLHNSKAFRCVCRLFKKINTSPV